MPERKLRFPELFDEQDVVIAENQPDYHFWEWLAAIVLYHATGFELSSRNTRTRTILGSRRSSRSWYLTMCCGFSDDVLRVLHDRSEHGSIQGPDLLMYAPDMSDWFFCEVKGPGDRLRAARMSKFEALATVSGKPVRLLHLKWAPDTVRTPAGDRAALIEEEPRRRRDSFSRDPATRPSRL
jgi:hypothetical protein